MLRYNVGSIRDMRAGGSLNVQEVMFEDRADVKGMISVRKFMNTKE